MQTCLFQRRTYSGLLSPKQLIDNFPNICSNDSAKIILNGIYKKTWSTTQETFLKKRMKVDEASMVNLGSDDIVLNIEENEENLVQVYII